MEDPKPLSPQAIADQEFLAELNGKEVSCRVTHASGEMWAGSATISVGADPRISVSDETREVIINGRPISPQLFIRRMTPEERAAQRESFAFGNANASNPEVTREMVREAIAKENEER